MCRPFTKGFYFIKELNAMNELDQKIYKCFGELVVKKNLVKNIKRNAIVPSYVLEYLVGLYCATGDEVIIQDGINSVKEILQHYVPRKEANLMLSKIREETHYKVIDKINVSFNAKDDVYEATFANLGINKVLVTSGTVRKNSQLLVTGAWCLMEIEYRANKGKKSSPWILSSIQLIQSSAIDFEHYIEARKNFTTDEWVDFLIQSIGLNPTKFKKRTKLLLLVRLIPFCERNFNFIELGPKSTGKSHIYSEFSPYCTLISGSEVSVPKLFVNNENGRIGLVGFCDAVAFDEFARKEKKVDPVLVDMQKNYMANKSFSRGMEPLEADASLVFVGNTQQSVYSMLDHSNLFGDLPANFRDSAFLDRLHFYLPGWEVPTIQEDMFSDGYGFMVGCYAEILHSMRKYDYSDQYKGHCSLSSNLSKRDVDAITKTFSGLMKIIHPQGCASKEETEELLDFAIEGRKRVKDHLMRIDPTFPKVTFTYQDTSGKVNFVSTVEEGKSFHAYLDMVVNGAGIREAASSEPLKEWSDVIFPNQRGVSFDVMFGKYFCGASKITITDPYIHRSYQIQNLMEFLGTVLKYKRKNPVAVHLATTEDKLNGDLQRSYFEEIKESFGRVGVNFTWELDSTCVNHGRDIVTDHGWKIILSRGLDIFRHRENIDIFPFANHLQRHRACEMFEVVYLKNDGSSQLQKFLGQQSNQPMAQ